MNARPFLSCLPFVLFFISCSITFENYENDPKLQENQNGRKVIDVAYYTPVYAKPNKATLKTTVVDPIPYSKAGKIITYKNYVLINKPQEGIHILDNTDPSAPVNLAFFELKGNIDMAIVDDRLYADMFSALVVIDVSEMENPKLIDDFTVEDVFYYDPWWNFVPLEEAQDYDYVSSDPIDHSKGIVIAWELEIRQEEESKARALYDQVYTLENTTEEIALVTNATELTPVSTAGSMARFLPIENYLYAINSSDLLLFEIDKEEKPNRWGKIGTNTWAETLYRLNDFLFVGSATGMLMYDVSEAGNPNFINKIDHFRSCDPVVADLEYAYVTLRGGTNCFTERNELQIIDIQNPKELEVTSTHLMFNPHGLAVHDNYVIVCDGSAGIKVVDVSNKSKPSVVETYPIEFAYDIILDFPKALVVGEKKLYQYDLSELPKLELKSESELEAQE